MGIPIGSLLGNKEDPEGPFPAIIGIPTYGPLLTIRFWNPQGFLREPTNPFLELSLSFTFGNPWGFFRGLCFSSWHSSGFLGSVSFPLGHSSGAYHSFFAIHRDSWCLFIPVFGIPGQPIHPLSNPFCDHQSLCGTTHKAPVLLGISTGSPTFLDPPTRRRIRKLLIKKSRLSRIRIFKI